MITDRIGLDPLSPIITIIITLSFLCTRCQEEDLIVAMNSRTGRILHCEKTASKKRFSFPLVTNAYFYGHHIHEGQDNRQTK